MVAGLRTFDKKITGYIGDQTFLLTPGEIFYADTVDRRTFLYGERQVYETPLKLYELVEKFAGDEFLRASKSSVINFSRIRSLRPDFGGRMTVIMENDETLTVSRQFVPDIKKKLYGEDSK